MLRTGPYPWHLKQRVMSNFGHLSNEALAFFLSEYFDGTGRKIMLLHLSRKNNHPQLAYCSALSALQRRAPSTELYVSAQDSISDVIEL
jgi:phosphoribosyl 1,2-cyclic phosphodiesterase